MPKDEWAKQQQRARARKALRDGTAQKVAKKLKKRRRKNGKKLQCRCCGQSRRDVGRASICLQCYKIHRKEVHKIADARSPLPEGKDGN